MATRALRTPSVLLVSHTPAERDVYTPTLRSSGYRVVHAATPVAAYQIAITRGTDIVVTDDHIAGSMSGLELTRRLRIHTRTTTVPIVVLLRVSRRQDGNVALKAGANIVLEMPVPAAMLRDQVARLLDESTSSRYTSSALAYGARHGTGDRNCPQCLERLEYRRRWPILSTRGSMASSHDPRERLRYASGWFCTNPACEYCELESRNG